MKNGEIITTAHNQVIKNNDPTCHGEINAIRQACKKLSTFDLTGCELYTTSSPCPMCANAIKWAHIDKVYSGCTVEDAQNIGFDDVKFETFIVPEERMDRDECLKLFEEYTQINERTHY